MAFAPETRQAALEKRLANAARRREEAARLGVKPSDLLPSKIKATMERLAAQEAGTEVGSIVHIPLEAIPDMRAERKLAKVKAKPAAQSDFITLLARIIIAVTRELEGKI